MVSPPFRPKTIKTDSTIRVKDCEEFLLRGSRENRMVRAVEPESAYGPLDNQLDACFGRARADGPQTRLIGIEITQKRTDGGRSILAETRRQEILETLRSAGSVTVSDVEARFAVSPVTARRDLDELERRGVLRRTHGGGVLPTTSAHEDSFARRLKIAVEAKRRLAEEAVALMAPGETVFLDSSTTCYFVARRIVETGIATTVLTNSFPVMELIFNESGNTAEIIGVGGSLRRLTRSFVGPFAVRTVQGHFADRLFLSVKGLTETGMMTDADALEAEVKRTMIAQAGESTLLVDQSKVKVRGLSVIASVAEVSNVIAHGLSSEEVSALRTARGSVRVLDLQVASAPERSVRRPS